MSLALRKRIQATARSLNPGSQAIERAKERLGVIQSSQTNQEFIDRSYVEGGKLFVETAKRYGCNERGEPIQFKRWVEEYYELIGDFRVRETLTTGCSQVGKTLGHTNLLCHCLTECGLNALWSYDKQISRDVQVPSNFHPVIRAWLERKGVKISKKKEREDKRNVRLYQIKGASAQFEYVSTSKQKDGHAGAAAGGNVVGVSRDILFKEERSQYPPGAGDPLNRRLDAGRLPSKPIRELGTPGGGQGIEAEVETADRYFYPHGQCEQCGQVIPLDPKGCLLKETERVDASGKVKRGYFSDSGRPLQWWHSDPNSAINTAYFACPHCGFALSEKVRIEAFFQCRKTGETLREFLDALPRGIPRQRWKVGICLSPLLRIEAIDPAPLIVEEGINTGNTPDWQQQRLGHPSEGFATNISLEILKSAIKAPRSSDPPVFTLAGSDQGRGQHWLWIARYYPPPNYQNLPVEQVIEQTKRVVVYGSDVISTEIPALLNQYGAQFGLIDNEPDRTEAAELARKTCLELADQKPGQMDDLKPGEVSTGGIAHKCWFLNNEKFLRQVLTAFVLTDNAGYPLTALPPEWERWLAFRKNERSPLTHLMTPSYNPNTGKWKRDDSHADHLYYAAMFCEAAYYLKLTHKPPVLPRRMNITIKPSY